MKITNITMEESVPIVSPLHNHPLVPFTGFDPISREECYTFADDFQFIKRNPDWSYIYGGNSCNEPGCEKAVFNRGWTRPLPEINHPWHPRHPLKLMIIRNSETPRCNFCGCYFKFGYSCSVCDCKMGFVCAVKRAPLVIPENSYVHEHPIHLSFWNPFKRKCKPCGTKIVVSEHYTCQECKFNIHVDCVDSFGSEEYHTSHTQHPLKPIRCQVPHYADKKCLLCEEEFDQRHHLLHHCDVCNFSICRRCMKNPPPTGVETSKTHQHALHLVPRLIEFTCDTCGTLGDRSPYFCLQCNFMVHRECVSLPRVININRHDHRISYTRRIGDGDWNCKVCRKRVNGFYGGYTCSKCPSFSVHARCATTEDVWDLIELEGTPEEEIIAPFKVIDENTIKHFGHVHNLKINKDGMILHESTLCVACVLQIFSEPFYRCEECDFILHEKCANLPRKKRHVSSNQPFTLRIVDDEAKCSFCDEDFSGFEYKAGFCVRLDVRCASISDSLEHESHPHPLYYYSISKNEGPRPCSRCGEMSEIFFRCDECDYNLGSTCAVLPKKVMINRYDDHPLFLSYGDMTVDEKYWCEACETKVNPKRGFYTCNDCGVVLHISCVVGDFSRIKPGISWRGIEECVEVVSNTSICRKVCYACNDRCKHPSIAMSPTVEVGVDAYFCSSKCLYLYA